MSDDEHAIRVLIDKWLAASAVGDMHTLLSLLADDVVFMQEAGWAWVIGRDAELLLT